MYTCTYFFSHRLVCPLSASEQECMCQHSQQASSPTGCCTSQICQRSMHGEMVTTSGSPPTQLLAAAGSVAAAGDGTVVVGGAVAAIAVAAVVGVVWQRRRSRGAEYHPAGAPEDAALP